MALPGLEDGALRLGQREIVALHRPAVELHAALVDHPAPVARRLAQLLSEKGRKVDLRLGHPYLRDIVRRLVLPHHAREVLLAAARALLPVPATHDPPREVELPRHGVVGM